MRLVEPNLVENCKCEPVEFEELNSLSGVADEMFQLMIAKNGAGLAAPQVGIFKRFFIIKNFQGEGYELFINPSIVWEGKKKMSFREGCLTYNTPGNKPEWWVKRSKSIMASWQNKYGARVERKMSGLTAEVFQHEREHLDGITVKNKS